MNSPESGPACACCQQRCWPMWATIESTIYCCNCYGIGCDTKPAECRRPLRDRIIDKVAAALS